MPDRTESSDTGISTAARRRRYARSPNPAAPVSLTPTKVEMLRWLAEMRFLSLPQLARLCCPAERRDLSEKSARRHMRELFDAGLADVLPVSRAALAPPGAPNDASLLYGSAPNVYAPTAQGLRLLIRAGVIGEELTTRPTPAYGPKNSLFLAHELAVRDVRVWLELSARSGGHEVERWRDGEEAAIGLDRPPFSVRPDAWFAYRMRKVVLVGLVEVDRGTERGDRRWGEKVNAYGALFVGSQLSSVTGYINARVLVFCPEARRRDALAALITDRAGGIAGRFWLAEHTVLARAGLEERVWRRATESGPEPLVPARPPIFRLE